MSSTWTAPFVYTLQKAFGKYLFITNTVSSGLLMLAGDLVEQKYENKTKKNDDGTKKKFFTKGNESPPEKIDYLRANRMFWTGISMGPVHHYFYKYLNKFLPGTRMTYIVLKILADQTIMSPVCIAQFFYVMGYLEHGSIEKCHKELRQKFLTVYFIDWSVWPPAQYMNFYLVPAKYQVFYINLVTMLYNVYLAYIKHHD